MSYTIGMVPDSLRETAYQAMKEGRLWWRCTDQHGRPANGGSAEPLTQPGQTSEAVAPIICKSGWHVTSQPHRWMGCRVFMVEGIGKQGDQKEDKTVFEQIRILAEVDPEECLAASVRARCGRKDLTRADLQFANLRNADLRRANLTRAYLTDANLTDANLTRADLTGANLTGAYLTGADLTDANLTRADLTDANLTRAYLTGADLTGADLTGAYLRRANLAGADLTGADLTGADLTGAYGYKGAE
jgi:hypothetical protein